VGLKQQQPVGEIYKEESTILSTFNKKTNKETKVVVKRKGTPIQGNPQNLRTGISELMIKIERKELSYTSADYIHLFVEILNPNPTTIGDARNKVIENTAYPFNNILRRLNFPLIEKITFFKSIKGIDKDHIDYKINKNTCKFEIKSL